MAWRLDAKDIDNLAAGCALLGSGGGGDTHPAILTLRLLVQQGREVRIVDLDELPGDALVVSVGFVGAPITLREKLFSDAEIISGFEAMQRTLGRPIDALIAAEIGGMNGLTPLIAGALLNVPVIDADGMGRAFPQSNHVAFSIYGQSATPTVVSSEHCDLAIIETTDNERAEHITRAICSAMGSKCFSLDYPLRAEQLKACSIPRTVTLAREIGQALRRSRNADPDPLTALNQVLAAHGSSAKLLFEGTVTAVEYDVSGGFGVGSAIVRASDATILRVDFQNEFLVAWRNDTPIATTPDIISFVDGETLATISSDTLRYGQRVKILLLGAPTLMATEQALRVVGPRAFGYDLDYLGSSAAEIAQARAS